MRQADALLQMDSSCWVGGGQQGHAESFESDIQQQLLLLRDPAPHGRGGLLLDTADPTMMTTATAGGGIPSDCPPPLLHQLAMADDTLPPTVADWQFGGGTDQRRSGTDRQLLQLLLSLAGGVQGGASLPPMDLGTKQRPAKHSLYKVACM